MTRSLILSLIVMMSSPPVHSATPADAVYVGGVVCTMEAEGRSREAVAIRDGLIVYVGSNSGAEEFRGPQTRWVDLQGHTVLPGLVDAHGHLRNLGRYDSVVKLIGTTSMAEVLSRVRSFQQAVPAGRWIRGRGWDQNDWEITEFPTWKDVDDTNANPIYLRRVDGHAALVNRAALELCKVTRDTPDPDGGHIVRDPDGNPTGVFIDNATELITRYIPEASPDELDEWMGRAIARCNEVGLTGVHDGGIDADMLRSLKRIAASDQLSLRVYCMLDSDDDDFVREQLAAGPSVYADDRLTVRALKVYADGALGSRGAALLASYADDPGNSGLLLTAQDKIDHLARLGLASGFQVCVHAIGDRGNRAALDAFEKALGGTRPDHRFRVEHCQILAPEDIPRFAKVGVIASMQPTHCTSDMSWAEDRVGGDRIGGAYAWRTLTDQGARLALGSDFPVESADPLWGVYAAVTRMDHMGRPDGGWHPGECLSVYEAVQGFTAGAAFASFSEDRRGTIAAGKQADLTVLDRNIFECAPAEILETKVLYTIVAGDVVYDASR